MESRWPAPAVSAAEADVAEAEADRPIPRTILVPLIGIFVILLFTALYFTRDVALPIVLALLFAITFSPVVRNLERRGISPVVTALALVFGLALTSLSGLYMLSGPVMQWIEAAPTITRQVQYKLLPLRRPIAAVKEMSQAADVMEGATDPAVQKVEVTEDVTLSVAAGSALRFLGMAGLTLTLLLFLLASGQAVHEKIVRVLPTFKDKKRALRLIHDVEREVSQYLLTVTAINIGLGAVVAVAMWLTGMPSPILWGVAAALLNFIPYLGAILGIGLVALVALVSFGSLAEASLPPLLYFAATALEGGIFTPLIIGRRLAINAVAILLALSLWAWLWGVVGALIAVPLLVALKAFCDHFEELSHWGEFLSPSNRHQVAEEEEPAAAGK
jgi:predicted PurR-regulated permease PerM